MATNTSGSAGQFSTTPKGGTGGNGAAADAWNSGFPNGANSNAGGYGNPNGASQGGGFTGGTSNFIFVYT